LKNISYDDVVYIIFGRKKRFEALKL